MAKKILHEQENINQPNEVIEEQSSDVELTKMEELETKAGVKKLNRQNRKKLVRNANS